MLDDRATLPVCVIDIGAPRNSRGQSSFGWAISSAQQIASGSDIDACARTLDEALSHSSVSLGIEAPLTLPLRNVAGTLTKARSADGAFRGQPARSWSAGAGPTVAIIALPILHYMLTRLPHLRRIVLDETVQQVSGDLLVWEAFVTSISKGQDHADDASLALRAFQTGSAHRFDETEDCLNTVAIVASRCGIETVPSGEAALAFHIPIYRL